MVRLSSGNTTPQTAALGLARWGVHPALKLGISLRGQAVLCNKQSRPSSAGVQASPTWGRVSGEGSPGSRWAPASGAPTS